VTNHPEKVEKTAAPLMDERIKQLRQIFPEAFAEGKIDFAKLREILSDVVNEQPERYHFTWGGKRDAIHLLKVPVHSTLVPCPEESLHFDTAENIFIEGDNLEVLRLLYKSYFARVKMIYIDPPYNTGKEFVYPDDYRCSLNTYLRLTGQEDQNGNLLTSNAETNGRYHSSWLSMMYPRLFVARQMLRDDGVIFVSIDDHEVHNLRLLMNEIFGEENFIANIIWQKKYTRSNDARWFSNNHEYILVFAKNKEQLNLGLLPRTDEQKATYSNPDNDLKGPWKATPLHAKSGKTHTFEYTFKNGVVWSPPSGTFPRYSEETLARLDANNEIWFGTAGKAMPARKSYLSEVKHGVTPVTLWLHDEVGNTHEANTELKSLLGGGIFDNPKPSDLIRRMLQLSTSDSNGDIVLDFFAGSCTTAHAVLKLNREDGGNRRFICVQLPEPLKPHKKLGDGTILTTVSDIGKERIRRVISAIQAAKANQSPSETQGDAGQLGVKVLKLSTSNYSYWQAEHEQEVSSYIEKITRFNDPLVDGWHVEDVIYEMALKEGYDLNCRVERLSGSLDNIVYKVTDFTRGQSFYVCLDDTLTSELPKRLNLNTEDLFICRDISFTDEMAANWAFQCHLKTV